MRCGVLRGFRHFGHATVVEIDGSRVSAISEASNADNVALSLSALTSGEATLRNVFEEARCSSSSPSFARRITDHSNGYEAVI
jgi:hypothetical protein